MEQYEGVLIYNSLDADYLPFAESTLQIASYILDLNTNKAILGLIFIKLSISRVFTYISSFCRAPTGRNRCWIF